MRRVAPLILFLLLCAPAAAAPQRLCTETTVTASDGVRLHAWVSRLAPDQRRPVLFMMDSYSRGGVPEQGPSSDNACPLSLPDDYVPAYLSLELIDRFTLVQVAYRGTGSSEGLFDMTAAATQRDIAEAVAWAAALPQSNGDVVLVGESGTGFYAHHALHEPSVRAAVIYTSCADMYRCFYRGGGYNTLTEVYLAATLGGYNAGRDARERMGLGANPGAEEQLAQIGRLALDTKTHWWFDSFWSQRSSLGSLSDVRVPVMVTTDLYDIVQPFDALQLIPGARLNLGMGHQSADTVRAGGARYRELVRAPVDRFVAHYGLGEANGAEMDPRVTLVTGTGGVRAFRAGQVLVRGAASWPLPGTRYTQLFLAAAPSGSAASLNDGSLVAVAPPTGGAGDVAAVASAINPDMRTGQFVLGANQATDLSGVERAGLTYTTPLLKRDLEVSGPIALRLFASASATDFDWAVRITDVWPDGRSEWITDGYLRASLRRVDAARSLRDAAGTLVRPWLTFDTPEPVPLDVAVEYQLDAIATSNVFRAGHRLRLDVLSIASAELDSARGGGLGVVTLLHDAAHPSSLTIPVAPHGCDGAAPLVDGMPRVDCASSYAAAVSGVEPPPGVAACTGRRVVIHLDRIQRRGLRSVRVRVGGRTVRVLRGARRAVAVQLAPGSARVTVRLELLRRTRRIVITRRYRPCPPAV